MFPCRLPNHPLEFLWQLCRKCLAGNRRARPLNRRKGNLVCVEELGINPEPRPVTVIETTVAVFVVAHQRIPDGGKMRPNLVGLSRNQMDFQKRQLLIPCQRKILRLNGGSIPLKVRLMRNDLYQVLPAVLFQKSLNPLPFCDPPFHGA